MKGILKRF